MHTLYVLEQRTSYIENCWNAFVVLQVLNSVLLCFDKASIWIWQQFTYMMTPLRGQDLWLGDSMMQCLVLTWSCHSNIGHLFPKEAYSDKGQGKAKDHPITGWKFGWDRVNIWAWKSVFVCIWVFQLSFCFLFPQI